MKNILKLLLGGRKSIKSARPSALKSITEHKQVLGNTITPSLTKIKQRIGTRTRTSTRKPKSKTIESSAIQKNFKTFIDEYESQYANIEKVKKGLKSDEEIFKLLYLKNVI